MTYRATAYVASMLYGLLVAHPISAVGAGEQGVAAEAVRAETEFVVNTAADVISSGDEYLAKNRFVVLADGHTLYYDLSGAPAETVLSKTDPLSIPLEAEIRVNALRRDFRSSVSQHSFWVTPLDTVEKSVLECVARFAAQQNQGEPAQCSGAIEQRFDELKQAIEHFATAERFSVAGATQSRAPVAGYLVQVKVEPSRARIRVMTALEYRKCIFFKVPLENQWTDLVAADQEMIGRYRYRAEWPMELGGPEEGQFEVRKPGTIVFRPKQP
jgi:hypothetical protein